MIEIANAALGLGLSSLDCLFLNAAIVPASLALLGAGMVARAVLERRAMARRLARYRAEAKAARESAELEAEINAICAELDRSAQCERAVAVALGLI